jgi:hypothetical protein
MSNTDPYNRPYPERLQHKSIPEHDVKKSPIRCDSGSSKEIPQKCTCKCPKEYWKIIATLIGFLIVGIIVTGLV